uniref:NADP-dependent oxidoreductase domain-containing protein n=1 Tax=Cyprinus carpio TaxID=7962 RepID=A0A8C2EZ14_CYPCA
ASSRHLYPSVLLNTGTLMPLLGLGTFRLQSQEDSYNAVGAALTAGYHVFDTAAICHNEAQLGHALRRYIDLCLIHTQGLPAGDKQNYWLLGFLITH